MIEAISGIIEFGAIALSIYKMLKERAKFKDEEIENHFIEFEKKKDEISRFLFPLEEIDFKAVMIRYADFIESEILQSEFRREKKSNPNLPGHHDIIIEHNNGRIDFTDKSIWPKYRSLYLDAFWENTKAHRAVRQINGTYIWHNSFFRGPMIDTLKRSGEKCEIILSPSEPLIGLEEIKNHLEYLAHLLHKGTGGDPDDRR